MKKLLFIPVMCLMSMLTSCDLSTNGNNASATLGYYGNAQDIIYTDSTNEVYEKYILDALQKDSIINTIFVYSSNVEVSSIDYAESICNVDAYNGYSKLLRKNIFTLDNVKRRIFSSTYENDTLFNKLIKDCDKYSDINISEFKLCVALVSMKYNTAIRKDTISIK